MLPRMGQWCAGWFVFLMAFGWQAHGDVPGERETEPRKIVLVRHGKSLGNETKRYSTHPANEGYFPAPLTGFGREQAAQAGADLLLAGYNADNISVIFSSPLPRTAETAEIIAYQLGVDKSRIRLIDGLMDRNLGQRDGMLYHQFQEKDHWYPENPESFQGETNEQVRTRMQSAWAEALGWPEKGHVLIVSHGQPIDSLITYLTGTGERIGYAGFVEFRMDGSRIQKEERQQDAASSR